MSDGRFRAIVAVHLFLVRDESVLLLRRAHTGYEDGNYSVPAGHLEGGETARAACAREAREESGIHVAEGDLRFALVMHRRAEAERIDFFFSATEWDGEPRNEEPEKCDELRWFPFAALPENTVPYVRRAFETWRSGTRHVEFGWE